MVMRRVVAAVSKTPSHNQSTNALHALHRTALQLSKKRRMTDGNTFNHWVIAVVIICGAVGGFVNVFIGDSGLHLPRVENDIFEPGFLGVIVVGAAAALGSWGAAKAIRIFGNAAAEALKNFSTGILRMDLSYGLADRSGLRARQKRIFYRRLPRSQPLNLEMQTPQL